MDFLHDMNSLNVCRNVCVMPGGGLKTGADQIM